MKLRKRKKKFKTIKNLVESRENSLNKRDELLQEREKKS